MAFMSEASALAAEAALCAADQGQFWPYHDLIFANQALLFDQGTDVRRGLKQLAEMLGLDAGAFDRCFDNREHRQDVQRERVEGEAEGVISTPTVFVNEQNLGYPLYDEVRRAVEEELAKAGQ